MHNTPKFNILGMQEKKCKEIAKRIMFLDFPDYQIKDGLRTRKLFA